MILLKLITWPYVRKHLLRTVLTMAGIVLGVAVFVSMHTANQSVLAAFHQTIDRIAGSTQLQISAGEAGFEESVLDRVREFPEVAAAAPVIEATANTGQGNLLILGVDMLGDRSLRNYDLENTDDAIDDPLVFLAQPDSLIITKTFADEQGLKNGSKLEMLTMLGNQTFTVRGIMKPGGLAGAFGGRLAIMDIYSAQKVFGRGYKFDRVDIALNEDVKLDAAISKISAELGPGFQVEPPSSRGQQFEATSSIYALASNLSSGFALFIGMFLIYNTFAIAVAERRSEIGILRALGATRGQIRTLFLTESAVSGLIGTVIGIAFGALLARVMAGYIGSLLSEVYGVAQSTGDVSPAPWLIAVAGAMGLATSLIAALLPARNAAGVDPVKALQKGRPQMLTAGENRVRRNWALVSGAAAMLAFSFSKIGWVFYAGYGLAILTGVLLAPAFSFQVARVLRPIWARIRPVEGTLAADSLIQAPRRTSGTITALMLSLALVISLGGLTRASYNALSDWMNIALNPDLFVTTAETVTARSFLFPASLGEDLRAMDGIDEVQFIRSVRIQVKGIPIMLVALPMASIENHAKLPPVAGDPKTMYAEVEAGRGVIISENLSRLHDVKFGEVLEIAGPVETLHVPVVGIVRDFSDQQGSILMDRETYIRAWHDDAVNVFRLYLKPGADEAKVRQSIIDRYAGQQRLFVLTNGDVRDFVIRITDQWFALTYVQIAVAVVVAILGIVNALTVSITDRRRELGILQAVGGLRNQIRHTIWLEAIAIGVIGLAMGLAMGAVQLYYSVEVARRALIGIEIGYAFPFTLVAVMAPVILGSAFIAALGPAESAVRGSLTEALEYE